MDAGCDEVRYSQKLVWRSRYATNSYQNEIDVLARRADRLVFVSCKALLPGAATHGEGPAHIFDAIKEVAYWKQHFGAGRGDAILLTTVDLFDELKRRFRNARLIEHAAVSSVKLVSADVGDYDGLVAAFRSALQQPGDPEEIE